MSPVSTLTNALSKSDVNRDLRLRSDFGGTGTLFNAPLLQKDPDVHPWDSDIISQRNDRNSSSSSWRSSASIHEYIQSHLGSPQASGATYTDHASVLRATTRRLLSYALAKKIAAIPANDRIDAILDSIASNLQTKDLTPELIRSDDMSKESLSDSNALIIESFQHFRPQAQELSWVELSKFIRTLPDRAMNAKSFDVIAKLLASSPRPSNQNSRDELAHLISIYFSKVRLSQASTDLLSEFSRIESSPRKTHALKNICGNLKQVEEALQPTILKELFSVVKTIPSSDREHMTSYIVLKQGLLLDKSDHEIFPLELDESH